MVYSYAVVSPSFSLRLKCHMKRILMNCRNSDVPLNFSVWNLFYCRFPSYQFVCTLQHSICQIHIELSCAPRKKKKHLGAGDTYAVKEDDKI